MDPVEEGVPPEILEDDDLMRELEHLHVTRTDALRHASDQALATHTERMGLMEAEYLRRHPGREVDPDRTREGARSSS